MCVCVWGGGKYITPAELLYNFKSKLTTDALTIQLLAYCHSNGVYNGNFSLRKEFKSSSLSHGKSRLYVCLI